jgi:GDP-L-fucose synthase
MKKRMLILGAEGFIGKNLANYFDSKYTVIRCVHGSRFREGFTTHEVDLTNKEHVDELFRIVKPNIVIHAAAVTTGSKDVIERPWLHVTDNLRMNALVMEYCHTTGVEHCLWFSCGVMYQPKDEPQSETDWKDGEELYPAYFGVGNMKVYTEKLAEFYSRQGRCKFTAMRNSNIYGPYDKFDLDKCHMLPAMVKKICDATDTLDVWGTGVARRDLLYIDDLVDLVDRCLEQQTTPYELINAGAGQAYSIQTIIEILQRITGKSLIINYNGKLDIPTTVIFNCDKAKKLGWEPKTSINEGLVKTVAYYESIKNNI